MMLDKQERRSSGKVCVHRVGQHHRDSHCRGDDHLGNAGVSGLHQVRRSHQHFAVMPFDYYALYTCLNLRTEVDPTGRINSPVHKTQAVRWTHDGVAGYVENGPVVDFDEIQVATETPPRRC